MTKITEKQFLSCLSLANNVEGKIPFATQRKPFKGTRLLCLGSMVVASKIFLHSKCSWRTQLWWNLISRFLRSPFPFWIFLSCRLAMFFPCHMSPVSPSSFLLWTHLCILSTTHGLSTGKNGCGVEWGEVMTTLQKGLYFL